MGKKYKVRYASSPKEVKKMNTKQLRKEFLIKKVMHKDEIKWTYSHYDRYATGGVIPVNKAVKLETIEPLKADYFLERRELGIISVGQTGTVKVEDIMHIERFSHVMHIVSDVVAILDDDKDMFDLFMATFTAGTMTGAPKIRAMELIAEYEGLKRGFYSGSVGYFGFDGNMDSAIAIRTALVQEDKVVLQAGAGIVADSVKELEYLEVNNKLGALIHSLEDLDKK